MKFKSDIEVQAGLRDGSNDIGTAGQLLSSTGTVTNWIDQAEVVAAGATTVLIACKNTSGGTITKGTPVYQTGNVGATDVIEVAEADALISTGYLPAIGLLETELINNAFGNVVITGALLNITTDPIDGLTPTTGDTIYLKSGGGLTLNKPTGEGNAIQNLGLVGKVSGGNAGSLTVASIMRQNDVPNLPTGKIWVGDGNTIVSDVVYLDETNERMGIRTTSPGATLEVQGRNSNTEAALKVTDSGDSFFEVVPDNSTTFKLGDIDAVGDEPVIVGGYSDLKFNVSGSTTMTLDNNNRVGIGTTNPGAKLDVAGTGSFSDSVLFNKSVPTGAITPTRYRSHTGYSLTSDSNYQKMVCYGYNGDSANPIFQVATKGFTTDVTAAWDNDVSTRFTVLAGGNVGIGYTSPAGKLSVSSNVTIGTNVVREKLTLSGKIYIEEQGVDWNETTPGLAIGTQHFDPVGNAAANTGNAITFGASDTNSGETAQSGIYTRSDATYGTKMYFATTDSYAVGSKTRMMIDSIGNVGIGTTSPDARLEVSSSAAAVLRLTSTDTTVTQFDSVGRLEFKANDTSTGGNNVVGFVDCISNDRGSFGTALLFGTTKGAAATEKMRINPTGNVGINDTTPSYKLDVNGEGRFTGDLRCLSLIQTSQSDKKESISDIVKTTNKKIEFKEYVYKSDSGNRKRYGVLAEDIEVNYPELVHVDADGVKGVNYIDLLVKRVSELEKEIEDIAPRSMFLNWRGYHSSTNNGVLYDSGWSTNLTYPYATIIAPFKGSVTKVSITNNPYSSYQSGPTGDRATLEVVIDGRVVDGVTVSYSKPSANEMITFNFSGNHEFSENDKVQLRFQSNGLWRYINTGIQLKETI